MPAQCDAVLMSRRHPEHQFSRSRLANRAEMPDEPEQRNDPTLFETSGLADLHRRVIDDTHDDTRDDFDGPSISHIHSPALSRAITDNPLASQSSMPSQVEEGYEPMLGELSDPEQLVHSPAQSLHLELPSSPAVAVEADEGHISSRQTSLSRQASPDDHDIYELPPPLLSKPKISRRKPLVPRRTSNKRPVPKEDDELGQDEVSQSPTCVRTRLSYVD